MTRLLTILIACCLQIGLQAIAQPPLPKPVPAAVVEYRAITIRSSQNPVTNIVVRSTADATNPPPYIAFVQPRVGGQMYYKVYKPVTFTWAQMDTLTGETNVIVTVETRNKSGFAKQRIAP